MTAGQWEQYVEPAAKVMHRERFGPGIPWGDFGPVMEEMELAEARAMLEAVGPRIAEDTRDRLVAAAGEAVERETHGLYYCPASGEIELGRGSGGFTVCCDRTAEHQPITPEAVEAARRLPPEMREPDLRAKLVALREVHAASPVPQPSQFTVWCNECSTTWPCPTAKILEARA